MNWQTKDQLVELLCSLVNHQSITGTNAEIAIAEYLYHVLDQNSYFKANPTYLKLHPLEDGRRFLTALVKSKKPTKKTVILLSHFDVVGVDDYGTLMNLAFYPKELTDELMRNKGNLPDSVQSDLENGDWLFGRGVMDMKAGITLHLSALERAINGNFDGNILMLSVPDEEVNSMGMLSALPVLKQIQYDENLEYVACLNGEPMFSKYPGDDHHYVYTGSIGKVLPGFYCYGKETHVGEPFAGLNPNLMVSFLSQHLELNEAFIEKVDDEVTPPPVSLMQRDLKEEYSVQTPNSAIAMYNILYLKHQIGDINIKLVESAKRAAIDIEEFMKQKRRNFSSVATDFLAPYTKVNVLMYEELYQEACKRYGKEEVERRQNLLVSQREHGDRDFSTILVQDLSAMCKDLAPMIVLFYSPPFYPAVSSKDNPLVQNVMAKVEGYAKANYNIKLTVSEFFTGLSDLSYIGPLSSVSNVEQLTNNMPLQNKGFVFPKDIIEELTMPVLNIGPLGKDPHQWTERLELNYSFNKLPKLLDEAINQLFVEQNYNQ
ncbi:M20/M25/M40 family metallo-hydrolase [Ornithinibacillus halophilus]|uniref:Arginine utilization protein RocB n=1 Tax=Ornithinibacillus halophilus TaxID=930117 RepID=A0A1M5CVC2_9BACI|nr:M20/M25/M40 family metallo-hydrolase [Ornithinibacillus halophilus]SHF58720.1 Arginine utilization protein RocB [Ornithinibacillus halophilus]